MEGECRSRGLDSDWVRPRSHNVDHGRASSNTNAIEKLAIPAAENDVNDTDSLIVKDFTDGNYLYFDNIEQFYVRETGDSTSFSTYVMIQNSALNSFSHF